MDDTKTIFRIVKSKDNPFVMIDRRLLENPALSWKAKGLLGYLLSRPDNWDVQMGDLINRATDGEFATRGAVEELMLAGHVKRVEVRDEQGRFVRFEYEVHESQLPPEQRTAPKRKPLPENREMGADEPFRGNPQMGNPKVGNLPLNNTESTNTIFGADAPKTPEAEKPAPPPAWGLGWQLGAGVKQVQLPSQEEQDQAKLMNALNLFHEHEQPFVKTFYLETGILPVKTDVAFWRKTITYLMSKLVEPDHLADAARQAFKDGMEVSSPKSLEKYAVSIRAKTRNKPAPTQPQETALSQHLANFKPRTA